MERVRQDIKSNRLEGLYLFTGEEKYLIKSYEKSLIKTCLKNGTDLDLTVFEGKNASPGNIEAAAETPPFLNDKRLVLVRNSELFTTKRKEDGEKLAAYFSERYEGSRDGAVILFIEDNVDKRGKAYKAINKLGKAAFFEPMSEGRLVTWLCKLMNRNNLSVSSSTASYLLRICGGSMEGVANEVEKLSAFKQDGTITKDDIDAICIKTAEARIFDLIDAVAAKNRGVALAVYSELLAAKEQPLGILAMISRQFRLILKSKLLIQKGASEREIAAKLGERPYSVKVCVSQAKGFSEGVLKRAAIDCADCDTGIKTGRKGDRLGVEMLIIKYTE